MPLKKGDTKAPQLKGDEAEQAILAYLSAQNRPYNASQHRPCCPLRWLPANACLFLSADVSLNMVTVLSPCGCGTTL